jgi:hypothetical protein
MPVVVQCFHCNAILELDDGFRGGVCRCSSCGSLLQVPRGEEGAPAGRKARPATPPPPVSPTVPLQSATSSKLDVGLSRGQFESPLSPRLRRQDIGVSSGLGRIHQTRPITGTPSRADRLKPPASGAAASATAAAEGASPALDLPPARRSRALLWLGLLLAFLITSVLVSMVIYYVYFYEP